MNLLFAKEYDKLQAWEIESGILLTKEEFNLYEYNKGKKIVRYINDHLLLPMNRKMGLKDQVKYCCTVLTKRQQKFLLKVVKKVPRLLEKCYTPVFSAKSGGVARIFERRLEFRDNKVKYWINIYCNLQLKVQFCRRAS